MKIKDWKIVKWAKRHKVLTGIALVLLAIYIIFSNWIYRGTVLDAATGKPIEGAVVVSKWVSIAPTISGPSSTVADVKEAVTDKNGKWMMRGSRLGQSPEFIVYKPGYCPWPGGYEIAACEGMYVNARHYGNVGEGETLKLPKLTKREDRWKAYGVDLTITSEDEKRLNTDVTLREFRKLLKQEEDYLWPQKK